MTQTEEIEFLKDLEQIAENCLETGIPIDKWTGEDTLKLKKIRKRLESYQKTGRPKKWATEQEKWKHFNDQRKLKK